MHIWKNTLKYELKQVFDAPPPVGKDEFLREHQDKNKNTWQFLWKQLRYIQLSTWGAMLGLFILTVFVGLDKTQIFQEPYTKIWMLSYLLPFWPCILIRESTKSRKYRMMELELASRHSLMQIILARVSVLGISEFVLLCIIMFIAKAGVNVGFLQIVTYLLVPLLLTSFLSLLVIQRQKKENETIYGIVVSAFVSIFMFVVTGGFPQIYKTEFNMVWITAFVLLLAGNGMELFRIQHKMEEGKWNLS